MKCSKCGHENPSENLFCEECDWRLDIKYVPEKKRNPLMFAAITLVLGIIAIVCSVPDISAIGGTVIGGIAMVIGGYSTGVARHVEGAGNLGLIISGIGLILGVVGFLMGFVALAGEF